MVLRFHVSWWGATKAIGLVSLAVAWLSWAWPDAPPAGQWTDLVGCRVRVEDGTAVVTFALAGPAPEELVAGVDGRRDTFLFDAGFDIDTDPTTGAAQGHLRGTEVALWAVFSWAEAGTGEWVDFADGAAGSTRVFREPLWEERAAGAVRVEGSSLELRGAIDGPGLPGVPLHAPGRCHVLRGGEVLDSTATRW